MTPGSPSGYALWKSRAERSRWHGAPSRLPDGLDRALAELPALRYGIDSPSSRASGGNWGSRRWFVSWPEPFARVYRVPAPTGWCAEAVREGRPAPESALLPVPPGPDGPASPHPPPLPEAIERYADEASSGAAGGWCGGWVRRPQADLDRWLEAAVVYLSRQHEIFEHLRPWAEAAAQVRTDRRDHASPIRRLIGAQERALDALSRAGRTYAPVADQVREALGERRAPISPEQSMLGWFSSPRWVIARDPVSDRHRVLRIDVTDPPRLDEGLHYRKVPLAELTDRYLRACPDASATRVEWDRRSLAVCDEEIRGLWSGLDAEYDLPEDFVSVWEAVSGYRLDRCGPASPDGTPVYRRSGPGSGR